MMTDEQRKLVTENHKLIFSFLNKYNYDPEEYYDLAAIGLCKAAKLYDESKGNFSTYAYRAMLNTINHDLLYKSRSKRIPENLIDYYNCTFCNENGEVIEYLEFIPSGDDIEKEVMAKVMVESFMNGLSDRDRTVVGLMADGYTYREIGKIIGMSRNTVSKIKGRIYIRALENGMMECDNE